MNETNNFTEYPMITSDSAPFDVSSTESAAGLPQWVLDFDIFWLTTYMVEKVVGLSANLLTIIAISKYEKLSQQPSNILIGSLALADCMNFLAAPWECIAFSNTLDMAIPSDKRLMNIACYLLAIFGILSFYGNACHIFVIALERFMSVNFPLFMRGKVTVKSAKITALAVWVVIIVKLTIDFIFLNNGMGFDFCLWQMVFSYRMYDYSIITPFVIISCFTLLLYIRIAYVTLKRSRKFKGATSGSSQSDSEQTSKSQKRVTKMMAMVMGSYYILYAPAIINEYMKTSPIAEKVVTEFLHLFFTLNSVINPFIYAWMSKEFSAAFAKLLHLPSGKIWPHKDGTTTGTGTDSTIPTAGHG